MEWKVQNALNRDVERQHLNKILKEIEAAIRGATPAPSSQEITRIVERVVRAESPDALTSVTVNISGDVSGAGTTNANGRVNINAVIDPSKLGIQDAPIDSSRYWRINGTWERVSDAVSGIQDITEPGIVIYRGGSPAYTSAMLEGTEGEIDVTNADGQDLATGMIGVGLADVEVVEGGTLRLTAFDSKGRRVEEDEADTDDLPEGGTNLYYEDSRVYTKVKDVLVAGTNVVLTPDDGDETITISATGSIDGVVAGTGIEVDNTIPELPVVSLSSATQTALASSIKTTDTPTDGDIVEYDGTLSEWKTTKGPRLIYLDGGNF